MATNNAGTYQQNGYPYANTWPSHISPFFKALGAVVASLAAMALLAKLLHFWLRSLKHAQEADAADRRRPISDGELRRRVPSTIVVVDHVGGSGSGTGRSRGAPSPRPQPPAPAAVAGEMVRAMGPLVCTYRRADGWPAEAACAVCLAELADGEALRVLPACMHYFHAACVGEWLRSHDTCPLCRAPLAPPPAAAAGDVGCRPPSDERSMSNRHN